MLLNYLYSNFLEEGAFAQSCSATHSELTALIKLRVFPAPSYVYENNGRSVSFVSDFVENAVYRFHLKRHTAWLR